MFTALFNLAEGMTPSTAILLMLSAAVCGLIIAVTAVLSGNCSRNFAISLIVLPMIIQVVILMVNGNIGTGVAVLGSFPSFDSAQHREMPGTSLWFSSQWPSGLQPGWPIPGTPLSSRS